MSNDIVVSNSYCARRATRYYLPMTTPTTLTAADLAHLTAVHADRDDDTDDGLACRIIEQGAGLAAVRRGCYVAGDGRLYRVERANGTIHTDDRRGNYLLAIVVEVEWDACDEAAIVQAKVAIGTDYDDIDD